MTLWRLTAAIAQAALDSDVWRTIGQWEATRSTRTPLPFARKGKD